MDAIKFINTAKKMCKEYPICHNCIFGSNFTMTPEDQIMRVQLYIDGHPAKTFLQDIKEKFPAMRFDCENNPFTCRNNLYKKKHSICKSCSDCWNEEMEEPDHA